MPRRAKLRRRSSDAATRAAARAALPTALLGAALMLGCGAAPDASAPPPAAAPVADAPADAPTPAQAPASMPTSMPSAEPITIADQLVAHPVPGHLAYVIEHTAPITANTLLWFGPRGTPILADTPWTPAATTALLDWIEARYDRLPAFATVSHFHLDAAGGIAALRARGVPVIASTETARLIAERAPAMQTSLAESYGDAFTGWTVAAPDRTFDPAVGHVETVDGVEVRVVFPAPAHAPDNTVTWIPSAGLLFGGCLVKGGDDLGNLGDADLTRYPDAITALQALAPRVVIPGHGRRTDPALLDNTARLLTERAATTPAAPR